MTVAGAVEFKYYSQELNKIFSSPSEDRQETLSKEKKIHSLFIKNFEQLLGNLITNPEYCDKTYEELKASLTHLSDEYRIQFETSLETIKTVANLLKSGDVANLDSYTKKMKNSELSHITTLNFCNLRFPQDLTKLEGIPNEEVRMRVMAGLINRDQVPLNELNLERSEFNQILPHVTLLDLQKQLPSISTNGALSTTDALNSYFEPYSQYGSSYLPPSDNLETFLIDSPQLPKIDEISQIKNPYLRIQLLAKRINQDRIPLKSLDFNALNLMPRDLKLLASYLTFVDCRDVFDDWSENDIDEFLNNCLQKAIEVFINSPKISILPDLPNCTSFDCSGCTKLEKLPLLPLCKRLNYTECFLLQKLYFPFSIPLVLESQNLSLPNDLPEIIKTQDNFSSMRTIAYLIHRDKTPLKNLNLSPKELIALAPHLSFLDCEGGFDGWATRDVEEFLNCCFRNVIDTTTANTIISGHKTKVAEFLKEFVFNYLKNSKHDFPEERLSNFQSTLELHSDSHAIEELKTWIELVVLSLKIDLPNASFIQNSNDIKKLKRGAYDDILSCEINKLEQRFMIALNAANAEIERYLDDSLSIAITRYKAPKNVLEQLLKATILRLEHLKQAGLDTAKFSQLTAKAEILQKRIDKMQAYYPVQDLSLKEASKRQKTSMGMYLDSRELTDLQTLRIPAKLQHQLSSIQGDFDKIIFNTTQLNSLASQRKLSKVSESSIESLSEKIIKMSFPKENADVLGTLSVAHLQGDRPTQEDTHLTTVLTVTTIDKYHKIPLYGLFDGHGGSDGAIFLAEEMEEALEHGLGVAMNCSKIYSPQQIEAAIFNMLKTLYYNLTQKYRYFGEARGGSTACIAFIIDNDLWISSLGDTRAILSVNGLPIALSQDAGLDTEEQKKTVIKRGGTITFTDDLRVNGSLNMSRSACEQDLSINTRPKIVKFPLDLLPPGIKCLCIACDGVFDILSSNFVAASLHFNLENNTSIDHAAISLVADAYKKGSRDNISTILVDLNQSKVKQSLSFTFQEEEKFEVKT